MNHAALRRLAAGSFLTIAGLVPATAAPASAGELALEGQVGYFKMAASNTGRALFGSDDGATYGGAARYRFWRGAFVSAGVRTFSKDGERAFVATANGPVQKLGFPLAMTTTPFSLKLGYRLRDGHTLVPYVAAGVAVTKYEVTSSVAGQGFDESVSKTGFDGAIGVEVGRGLLRFAAEGGWSAVPNAIGEAGVSKVYGEDDIGGTYVIGKVVLAFGL
jgi:opacity protein-like surface antigen